MRPHLWIAAFATMAACNDQDGSGGGTASSTTTSSAATTAPATTTTGAGGDAGAGGAGGGTALDCNPQTGLAEPLRLCTAAEPCTNVAMELGQEPIDTPEVVPICATTQAGMPVFDDGPPISFVDSEGNTRHHCRYAPPGASPSSKRPLVVWMHGGGGGLASDLYDFTLIRQKAEAYDLTGDPARPGFHVIAVQGQSAHYPTGAPRDGHHHDFYYRDLASPSTNRDVANVDRLIDEAVATGAVDESRIYLMGWSNGGFFGQMYSIARHEAATPGGNHVAGISLFSSADPFNNTNHEQVPSCQLDPYPTSTVPIFLVSRACDIVACDQAQVDALAPSGFEAEPGHVVETWIADLATKVQNPNVTWLIVSGIGTEVNACSPVPPCSLTGAVVNHIRWPQGIQDGSGIDHEPAMLDFLRQNPLP